MKPYLVLMAAFLFATSAYADWQWTKWGMTVDEVIAASKGTVGPRSRAEKPGSNKHLLAGGAYSTLGMEFDAGFYFNTDDHGLSLVELRMHPIDFEQCRKVKDALLDVYGPPRETGGVAIIRLRTYVWRDEQTGNRVVLATVESSPVECGIEYSPFVDKAKSGL